MIHDFSKIIHFLIIQSTGNILLKSLKGLLRSQQINKYFGVVFFEDKIWRPFMVWALSIVYQIGHPKGPL